MSNLTRFSLLFAFSVAAPAIAQDPSPKPAPPALTQQQVDSIVKQLADIEKEIAEKRGGNITTIIQKLRAGAASDAAALALYEDCETLNADRRALTRDDKKAREDQIKRQADRNKDNKATVVKEEGDFGTAVRLQLRYLALTLQAHETKDMETLLPELASYIQDVVANAEKLKGRAGAYLGAPLRAGGGAGGRRGGGQDGNPFIAAFQLDHYMDNNAKWSMEPLQFGDIFDKAVFPIYREKKKSELGTQWDARMSAEAGLRKGSVSDAEYAIWQQTALLDIKWRKLKDLYAHGDKPVDAMAQMLSMIRENPSHPASPDWLDEFRGIVAAAVPGTAPTPPATAQ